jgi:hypothetical protein
MAYSEAFLMQTRPTTRTGKAKVYRGRGITINGLQYWHERMMASDVAGQTVPVRFEPYDMGVAYAYIDGQWLECVATEARTGEFKIEEAKKESERELQRLLGKPSIVPMSVLPHSPSSIGVPASPLPVQSSHPPSRIERASYRDPVGEQIVTTTTTKCTYVGIIEVSSQEFQEAGITCVECPTCGARRTLKSPKDRPHFSSHTRRLTPPPKGERRWREREQIWKLAED